MSNHNGKRHRSQAEDDSITPIVEPPKKRARLNKPNDKFEGVSIKFHPVNCKANIDELDDQPTPFTIQNPSTFAIGSDESKCSVISYHPDVSPVHAQVSFDKQHDTLFIQTLDSAHDVFVNEIKIQMDLHFALKHGDTIKLASNADAIRRYNSHFINEYRLEIIKNDTNQSHQKQDTIKAQWTCTRCTLRNDLESPICIVCDHKREPNPTQNQSQNANSNQDIDIQIKNAQEHKSVWGWDDRTNASHYKPYPNTISETLNHLELGHVFVFTLHGQTYEIKKITSTECEQRNISTGYKRHVKRTTVTVPDPTTVAPFVPHMKYHQTLALNVSHIVDVRDKYGQWFGAQIIGKNGQTLRVHYTGWDEKYDEDLDCRYHQWKRFATYGSITQRDSAKFDHLKINDFIDINPMGTHPGWRIAEIQSKHGAQIRAGYLMEGTEHLYWVHADDTEEIAAFGKRTNVARLMDVESLFFESLRRSDYEITEVQKIADDESIYEAILKKKLNGQNKDRESVEQYLWHGTRNVSNLEYILKNGFDRSFNSTSKFGKGTYFAKHAKYSVENGYCGRDGSGVSYIVLCKVIVGDYTIGTSNMKVIAKKKDGSEYDSLVNRSSDPTVFVVWRDYHAVPYRVVKFVSK